MKRLTMISISRSLMLAAAAVVFTAAPVNADVVLTAVTSVFVTARTDGSCSQTIVTSYYFPNGDLAYTDTVGPKLVDCKSTGYFLPSSGTIPPITKIIPQFVDGGGWQTTLVLTNTTASKATATLSFYQETPVGDGSTQGWGRATVSDGVEIYAIFKFKGGSQGTAPGATVGNHIMLPYNNTPGNVTAIAVANPTGASEVVSVSFQSDGGAISRSSMTIPAQGHSAFVLPTQFAGTAGDRGLAEFYTANGNISLIGLQFDPVNFFFSSAQSYPVSRPVIIGGPDPEACWRNPFSPPCPQPPFLLASFSATISSSPVQIVITPGTGGTYNAAVGGAVNGATVSGSFVGGTITTSAGNPSPLTFAFTSVGPQSTFNSGSLNFALEGTAFDAAVGKAVGNVTGSITLNQANIGSGPISGTYDEIISLQSPVPLPALTFSVQSRSPGTGNLLMAVTNAGGAAATNVTITTISGITASGATFVYVPGLLNPPFVVPGGANLAPGSSSSFNLIFQATSGSAGTPFSFVITAKADNVAAFTTTINVP